MSKTHILSAGFLFYSHPPNSNNIYFLLGKDDYNGKWSDFGGRRTHNESEIECATREMIEETLNTVKFTTTRSDTCPAHRPDDQSYESYAQSVKNILLNKDYTYRIGMNITFEKERELYMTSKNKFNPQTLAVSSTFQCSNFTPCVHASSVRRLRVCYVKYIPWQPELPLIFSETYAHLYQLKKLKTLSEKITYFELMPKHIQNHPAISVEYHHTQITCITVFDEWMEKQQIAWFSLRQLRCAVKNGGKFKKHVIRYGFLSTLSVAIECMSQQMKKCLSLYKSILTVDSKLLPYINKDENSTNENLTTDKNPTTDENLTTDKNGNENLRFFKIKF